jgi:Flp pilus assembly protein TadG
MMAPIMKAMLMNRLQRRLRRTVMRLRDDTRGIAAVEFAMIVPLMLVMFFGTIEISSGVAVDRKITMITQTLSDLTSRYTSVTSTDISNFAIIAKAMLTPYATTPLTSRITELYIDPSTGKARVQWSVGTNPYSVSATPVTVPAALISKTSAGAIVANQYLILAEASYLYTPTVGYVMSKAGVTLSDVTYTRPRQSTCVIYMATSTTSTTCPTN